MQVTWARALSWRMSRHLLDPIGTESVAGVVGRLCAIPAASDVNVAIRTRQQVSAAGDVERALASGEIIKTYAFRGAVHLMTPANASIYLALRTASRQWELPSWQSFYGLTVADWPRFRQAVRDALGYGPLSRTELAAAVAKHRRFAHLGQYFTDGSDTLLKPLAWHGDMTFGTERDTFQRLDTNPRWPGLLDLDDAGPRAVEAYFRSYGPATADQVHKWLGSGLSAGRKRITAWIASLADRLAPVDIAGETVHVLRDDLDELMATKANDSLRLLPGYDQWVLGTGTDNEHVVPPAHRQLVSRQANLVICGGVLVGTWSTAAHGVQVDWFDASKFRDHARLTTEEARVSALLG